MDNIIFNENCIGIKGMKNIESESIDAVITDPPYRLNKTTGGIYYTKISDKWNGNISFADTKVGMENNIKFSDWLPEIYRVLKQNSHCYIWTNDKNLCDLQNAAQQVGFKLHNILVWEKNNKTPNRWYMKNCEFILFLHKGKSFPINNLNSSQLIQINNIYGKNKLHPTQKPIECLEEFICNSSKENDLILDPFMGSGSTAIACLKTNRKFIGYEIDKKYFDIAIKRIEMYANEENNNGKD